MLGMIFLSVGGDDMNYQVGKIILVAVALVAIRTMGEDVANVDGHSTNLKDRMETLRNGKIASDMDVAAVRRRREALGIRGAEWNMPRMRRTFRVRGDGRRPHCAVVEGRQDHSRKPSDALPPR